MLQFEDVTFGYGDRILFDHYSLSLPDNSISVLQGHFRTRKNNPAASCGRVACTDFW